MGCVVGLLEGIALVVGRGATSGSAVVIRFGCAVAAHEAPSLGMVEVIAGTWSRSGLAIDRGASRLRSVGRF